MEIRQLILGLMLIGIGNAVTIPRSALESASVHGQHVLSDGVTHLQPFEASIGFASFGDSYSAGIGTGGTLPGEKYNICIQGLSAWPALLHASLSRSQGRNVTSHLQWLACTGSTTEEILSGGQNSQVDDLNTTLPIDFATVTVGGNDVGFFDVINACIFRFYSFYSGTCEQALARADAHIRSSDFEQRLSIVFMEVLDKIHWERRPEFFITVVGYAQFFNDVTPECDEYSLGVWWGGPRMTREIRRRTNDLVLAVNEKLKRTIAAVNARFARDKILFVDIDPTFEGHRFCEPGVVEPDYGRLDTWFFLVGGPDNAGNKTQWPNATMSTMHAPRREAEQKVVEPEQCLAAVDQTQDWGRKALCYMATAKHRDPSLEVSDDVRTYGKNGNWWVPTYYGQSLHPRSKGHEAIMKRVRRVWADEGK